MRHRPFAWCVCWLVFGAGIVHHVPTNSFVTLFAVAATSACVALFVAHLRWVASACGMAGAGLLLAVGAHVSSEIPDDLALLAGTDGSRPVEIVGVVETGARWNDNVARARVPLSVEQVKLDGVWHPWRGRTLWSWYEAPRIPEAGERVQVSGRLRNANGWRNFGLFDYGAYLRRQNLHTLLYSGSADTVTTLDRAQLPMWKRAVVDVRTQAAERIARVPVGNDVQGMLLTVLVGDRRWLSDDVRDVTEVTGTYHLLSISGLHVGIVAGWLLALARLFRRGSPLATGLILAGLAAYTALTGGAVPVVRAAIMCGIAVVLLRARRPPDGTSILALAAAVIMTIDPLAFHSAGTQLSFVATGALVLAFPPTALWIVERIRAHFPRRLHTVTIWLAYAALAPLIVQVAITPFLLWHFQQLPLLSVLANIVATPLLFVMIAAGLATVVGFGIHPAAGLLPSLVASATGTVLLTWLEWIAVLRVGPRMFAAPSFALMAAAALVALACWYLAARRPRLRFASVGLWVGVALVGPLPDWDRALKLHVLDVGHGSATLVEFPDGHVMLVDAGRRSRTFDVGRMIVEPYLLRQGIRKLDYVVATHPQNDHIGGLIHLVERFPIGELWTNGDSLDTWTSRRFDEVAAKVPVRVVMAGDTGRFGAATVQVLGPQMPLLQDAANATNNNSVVLRIDYGGVAVLLPGDASETLEAAIAMGNPWPGRVLVQAPHHGYPRPNTMRALRHLQPLIAWASLTHTWPERRNLEGLGNAQSRWRTDADGGLRVTVTPDGAITMRSATGRHEHWPALQQRVAPMRVAAPLTPPL